MIDFLTDIMGYYYKDQRVRTFIPKSITNLLANIHPKRPKDAHKRINAHIYTLSTQTNTHTQTLTNTNTYIHAHTDMHIHTHILVVYEIYMNTK